MVPVMRSTIASSAPLAALAALALGAAPAPAAAQESLSQVERAQAEALFREGKKLLAEGKVAEACEKLAASYKIDRAGGTALNLALCHEREGKTATAWAELQEALAMAKAARRKDREKIAGEHIAALEKKLSHVVIKVAPGADLPELEVTLDGAVIRKESWGIRLPADPGARKIAASAPGRVRWEKEIEVGEAASIDVEVPALQKEPEPPKPPPSAGPAAPEGGGGSEPARPTGGGSTWMRPVGFVTLGVGVAGLAVGGFFGFRAISLGSDAEAGCNGAERVCDTAGWDAYRRGRTSATISNVLIGAGAGLAAVGTALVLLGGGSSEPAPEPKQGLRVKPSLRAGVTGAALGLEGTW